MKPGSRSNSRLRAVVTAVFCACAFVARAPADGVAWAEPLLPSASTYATLANEAVRSLLRGYYLGHGLWRDCPESNCWVHNGDWGVDSLTDTLYLAWKTTGDATLPPILAELAATARDYEPPCLAGPRCVLWSDVPLWDSVSALREHEVFPNDPIPLRKAVAAFWAVEGTPVYAQGACPAIRYQRPFGRGDRLKTLETDSNGIKAALLLYDQTRERRYLAIARTRYAAVRRYYLDRTVPLYSVYVFDDGKQCVQAPHRFFASVNGNMIANGLALARATHEAHYRVEALATAGAIVRDLSDPSGVFTDLQAENDIEEPLVAAMLELATVERVAFARTWLLENASAAYSARRSDGTYGRFFDGPPPEATVTAWQTSGGFAVQIAAASLAPRAVVRPAQWAQAPFVSHEIAQLPATLRFYGSGIAVIGTIGEVCCQPGHARVFVDGVETTNRIGIWQNKSSAGRPFPNSVLFAWRWPTAGTHTIGFLPGAYDAKEGGSFLHVSGYRLAGGDPNLPASAQHTESGEPIRK